MSKIRLIAVTLLWSALAIGIATFALIEGVQGKPDRSARAAMEAKDRPSYIASAWKDKTGAPYRRRTEPFDEVNSSQPTRVVPTVWQDPPRR